MSERMQNLTGETIVTIDGNKHRLGKMAGYGAQGVVYEDNTGTKMLLPEISQYERFAFSRAPNAFAII